MGDPTAETARLAEAMERQWLSGVIFDPSPSGPPKINWDRWAGLILAIPAVREGSDG